MLQSVRWKKYHKVIQYDKRVIKEIQKFPKPVQLRFLVSFEKLAIYGYLSEPEAKKLKVGEGLFEVRVRYKGQWRALYVYKQENTILVISAFQKKTQKTEKKELKRAMYRLKQYLN